MKPIHFVKIIAFAKDNNLETKSFDSVVSAIKDSAKTREVSIEEYLEQY